jgi:hypothetical protein
VVISGGQLKAISNRPSFAKNMRPSTHMKAAKITMSTVEAPSKSTPLIDVEKYLSLPAPVAQNLERSVFNLYEKPDFKPREALSKKQNFDRSVFNLYEKSDFKLRETLSKNFDKSTIKQVN